MIKKREPVLLVALDCFMDVAFSLYHLCVPLLNQEFRLSHMPMNLHMAPSGTCRFKSCMAQIFRKDYGKPSVSIECIDVTSVYLLDGSILASDAYVKLRIIISKSFSKTL